MSLSTQRTALCDALDAVDPSAPTLCEGWTAHHLAAHVWLRENDLIAAAGAVIKPLAGHLETRMTAVMNERPYAELVAAIRRGPQGVSLFRLPGAEQAANSVEFFVHCEDVRRGSGDRTQRPLDPEFEEYAWKRLRPMARLSFRRVPAAVWLKRHVADEPLRVGRGGAIVTLVGPASELLLYLFGRTTAANVALVGEAASIDGLQRANLGI
ncbi:MAG TPA: TIGR03085 family metal-binding protein [Propionicimonas sp.]|nr:TIGR03085 family metal-binding protein [Propionicimonas sp.]HRA05156.1 TIGR03085 family metal-binding protein [Propionicimonas sp.]HRA74708.1 TIGR03085 family metal-binding protein [Propionicimonas sp.]